MILFIQIMNFISFYQFILVYKNLKYEKKIFFHEYELAFLNIIFRIL